MDFMAGKLCLTCLKEILWKLTSHLWELFIYLYLCLFVCSQPTPSKPDVNDYDDGRGDAADADADAADGDGDKEIYHSREILSRCISAW